MAPKRKRESEEDASSAPRTSNPLTSAFGSFTGLVPGFHTFNSFVSNLDVPGDAQKSAVKRRRELTFAAGLLTGAALAGMALGSALNRKTQDPESSATEEPTILSKPKGQNSGKSPQPKLAKKLPKKKDSETKKAAKSKKTKGAETGKEVKGVKGPKGGKGSKGGERVGVKEAEKPRAGDAQEKGSKGARGAGGAKEIESKGAKELRDEEAAKAEKAKAQESESSSSSEDSSSDEDSSSEEEEQPKKKQAASQDTEGSGKKKRRRRRRSKKTGQLSDPNPGKSGTPDTSAGRKPQPNARFQDAGLKAAAEQIALVAGAKRMVFDEEGNAQASEVDSSNPQLQIGEWSAPANHKKGAWNQQQREQRNRLQGERLAPKQQATEEAAQRPQGMEETSSTGQLPDSYWESLETVEASALKAGDEIAFKIVELAGWVPTLSPYKKGRVMELKPSGETKILVTYSPVLDAVVPKIRDRTTGDMVEVEGTVEEPEEQEDQVLVTMVGELQELRLVKRFRAA